MKLFILHCKLGLAYFKLAIVLYMIACTSLQTYQWYQSANRLWTQITTVQQAITSPLSFLPWNSPSD